MTRPASILSLLLGLAAAADAASGAAWLSYPHSARNVADGGGLGVLSQGLHALSLNPAGLAGMKESGQVQLSHSQWAGDIRTENLGAAIRGGDGVLAVAGTWVDFGAIQAYSVDAGGGLAEGGTLRPSAASVQAAWASPILRSGVSYGIGLALLSQNLEGSRHSLAPSVEGGLKAELGAGFSAGLSVLNAGSPLDGSDLPLQGRLGLAWGGDRTAFQLGAELAAHPGAAAPDFRGAARLTLVHELKARVGWQQLEGAAGQASLGLSFQVAGRYDLDYAFTQQGAFGGSHHIGLGLRWL